MELIVRLRPPVHGPGIPPLRWRSTNNEAERDLCGDFDMHELALQAAGWDMAAREVAFMAAVPFFIFLQHPP